MKPVFKIALLLSLLLVVCFPSLGQNAIDETKKPVLDSLRVILKTPGVHDTSFAKATVMLSELVYWQIANDTGMMNSCNRTIDFVDKKLPTHTNKKIRSSLLNSKALALNNKGYLLVNKLADSSGVALLHESIRLYSQTNNSAKQHEPYWHLMSFHKSKDNKDSALYYARKVIAYSPDKLTELEMLDILIHTPSAWKMDVLKIAIGDTIFKCAIDTPSAGAVSSILNYLGQYFRFAGDYTHALKYYTESNNLKLKFLNGNEFVNIGHLYSGVGEEKIAKVYYLKAFTYARDSIPQTNPSRLNAMAWGEVHLGQKIYNEYPDSSLSLIKSAIQHWKEAGKDHREWGAIAFSYFRLAEFKMNDNRWAEALVYVDTIKMWEREEPRNSHYSSLVASRCYYALGQIDSAEVYATNGLRQAMEGDVAGYKSPGGVNSFAGILAKIYAAKKNYELAYTYQRMADSTKAILKNNDNQLVISYHRQQQDELELQKQQAEKDHDAEVRQRTLAGGALVLFILAGGLFGRLRYVRKTKKIIEKERDRSENLLLNILPAEVATELKEKGESEARDFDNVSVLFSDFQSFTQTSEKLTAKELVTELNMCFKKFDEIVQKYEVEKIKTIGDAYMAAGGLHIPRTSEPKDVVMAALEMQQFMVARKQEKEAEGQVAFSMRVGIHTGPVVAGIVGIKKFQYDIWGDTVNTASRMETNSQVGKVNISQATYELLKDDSQFTFERREKIEVKGKGLLQMWFVSLA